MSQNFDIENEEVPDNSSVPQEDNDNNQTQNEDAPKSIEKLEIEEEYDEQYKTEVIETELIERESTF